MKRLALIGAAVVIALVILLTFYRHPPVKVTINFNDRVGGAVIPPHWFGIGGIGTTVSDPQGMQLITSINLLGNRIFAQVDSVYRTSTPDYSALDAQLKRAMSDGLDTLIVINGTPPSLGTSSCAMPSDVHVWGRYAADIVAHIDTLYPGKRYEIWNEPDSSNSFCVSDPLNNYLALYAAAAPEMKKAAPAAKIGGPTLASPGPNAATWIPAFLSGATATYVDFVSWHLYPTGQWDLDNGDNWGHVYSVTQDPAKGLSYYTRTVEGYVRKGNQPNAASTPVYLTEYNLNHVFKPNCCANSNTYGALWNSVAVIDFFNVVNDGGSRPLDGIFYFMSSASGSYFCVIGRLDDNMNCTPPKSGEAYQTYPQYTAFQVLTDKSHLDLEETGANVLAAPALPNGLIGTVFYTPDRNCLLIANPTDKAVTLDLTFTHLGKRNADGLQFQLTNGMLDTEHLALRIAGVDSMATVTVIPAYSSVAISL